MSDRIKVVLDIGEKDCMVGVGQEGCDPHTTTYPFGEKEGLAVVLAAAVRVVETARVRWKEAKRNPTYKPAPPPKPEVKAPAKGKELSLLEDKDAAPPAPETAAAPAAPSDAAFASPGPQPPAPAPEPEIAPTAEASAPAPTFALEGPGPAVATEVAPPEPTAAEPAAPTVSAGEPKEERAARGNWVYYLKNTGKPELDGKGPFDSTLAALDALGVPQEGRGKFWHRHDRLPKKYADQLDRRPKP